MQADPRAEERVGSVLHEKWTLERLVGVGGMGAVYAARHRNGARAAVKVLSPQAGRTPHIRKRFLHEGYAANRVEHPGAVKVLDDDVIADGPDEGTAYLVMELLEGESLHERAKRDPPLTEHDLLVIADSVLAVLEAAHEHGVVHRDLKPDNLFLVGERQVKVLDFGLARLLESQEQTLAGMAVGTPTYMSPEQAGGHVDQIDGRTDLYALGSILFQLATRQRIHDAAHTLGLVIRMATTPAPKIRTVAPHISEAFAQVVDHALAFNREERYPNAAAMRADVLLALGEASVGPPTPRSIVTTADVANANTVAAGPTALAAVRSDANATESSTAADSIATPKKRGSLTGVAVIAGLLGIAGFAAWEHRAELEARLQAASAPTVTSASPPASVVSPPASASETPPDAALLVPPQPALDLDAGTDLLDDGGGADAGDAGDDEEEEEEEETDASAPPSGPSPQPSAARRAPTPRPNASKGAPTHKVPRKPGQPPKKKRWHW